MKQNIDHPLHIRIHDFDDRANPLLGAGQAWATFEVGKRLVRHGHRVTVITSRFPGSRDRVEQGITYVHIGIGTRWIQLNNLIYILLLPIHTLFARADIIVDCFTAPISTLCSQLFTRIPVVGLPTSFEAEMFSRKYHLPFTLIERIGARTYRYFLPYTQYYAEKMRRLNPTIQQHVVPEGVDASYLKVTREKPTHILFLGRIDFEQKGLDLLLQAWERIQSQVHLPLVIAGKGTDEPKLLDYLRTKKFRNTVTYVGQAFGQKKRDLLARSAFVVFPSRHEGFSLFALEALASGNPLVCFDIPGMSWVESEVVEKVQPYDVNRFAYAILSAYTKTSSRRSTLARTIARQYTWEAVAQSWLDFFTHIKKENI